MTIGEIDRYIKGFVKREERFNRQRASYDYQLASTIIRGVSVVFNGGTFPSIQEVYPDLFEEEDKTAKSVANFINFANSFNRKYKEK